MKDIFKYVGAVALATTITLSSSNVYAAENCKKTHTDYYMFLNEGTYDTYKSKESQMAEGKALTYFTAANKTNQIKGKRIIQEGPVAITRGSESTVTCGGSITCPKTWTVSEYWRKYYQGQNATNLVYTTGDESYLFHSSWYRYGEEGFGSTPTLIDKGSSSAGAPLRADIESHLNNMDSYDLVTKGTNLPITTVAPDGDLKNNNEDKIYFKVSRVYNTKDIVDGYSFTSNNTKYVFSPGAYMVEYCVEEDPGTIPDPGTDPDPVNPNPGDDESTDKKILKYDGNATGVTNVPSQQEFGENCTSISKQVPERNGYIFKGWNSKRDGSGTTYTDQYCGDSTTIYAQWDEIPFNPDGSYTLTYDANGGKDAPSAENGSKDKCIIISDRKPTLANSNFLGWSRDKDAKEADPEFAAGKEYCGKYGNVTVYAVWQPKTGVSAHLIGFAAAAIAAGAALVVAKKKDLFKQI